jgi:methionyl-tRNA synthetase
MQFKSALLSPKTAEFKFEPGMRCHKCYKRTVNPVDDKCQHCGNDLRTNLTHKQQELYDRRQKKQASSWTVESLAQRLKDWISEPVSAELLQSIIWALASDMELQEGLLQLVNEEHARDRENHEE